MGGGGGLPQEELSVVVWDEVREQTEEAAEDGAVEEPWKKEREAWEELEVRSQQAFPRARPAA